MKPRNSRLPKIYYFKKLSDVDTGKIQGNAIVFAEEEVIEQKDARHKVHPTDKHFIITTKACFKHETEEVLRGPFVFKRHGKSFVLSYEGQRDLYATPLLENIDCEPDGQVHMIPNQLVDNIYQLAITYHFPYQQARMTFTDFGRGLKIEALQMSKPSLEDATLEVKQAAYRKATLEDNIHPSLRKYLADKSQDELAILKLLYEIKASKDFGCSLIIMEEVVHHHRKSRLPVNDIERMIHQAYYSTLGIEYLPLSVFKRKVEDLIQKPAFNYPLIMQDFLKFLEEEVNHFVMRTELVKAWQKSFEMRYHIDSFEILNQQPKKTRRFFDLSPPDAMELFQQFVAGEELVFEPVKSHLSFSF